MKYNKISHKVFSLIIIIILLFTIPSVNCLGECMTDDNTTEYKEAYGKISLHGLNIDFDDDTLILSLEEGLTKSDKAEAENSIDEMMFMTNRYDNGFSDLVKDTLSANAENNAELIGISYSECPLQMTADGDFVRVSANNPHEDSRGLLDNAHAASRNPDHISESGQQSEKYYFSLITSVSRVKEPAGDGSNMYVYIVVTSGVWSKNSFLGGEKYPAGGNDYMLQATPNSFSRTSDYLTVHYSNSTFGKSGVDYARCDGSSDYIKYELKDDPLGNYQMNWAKMYSYYLAESSSTPRTVNSYYVHTWKKMTISVEISGNTSKEVSLTITPSIRDKSWQLYSYVTFTF